MNEDDNPQILNYITRIINPISSSVWDSHKSYCWKSGVQCLFKNRRSGKKSLKSQKEQIWNNVVLLLIRDQTWQMCTFDIYPASSWYKSELVDQEDWSKFSWEARKISEVFKTSRSRSRCSMNLTKNIWYYTGKHSKFPAVCPV